MERNYFLLLSVLLGVSMFAQEKDSLGMKKKLPDTEENRRIKEWDAQTALAKLEEEIWFKKL